MNHIRGFLAVSFCPSGTESHMVSGDVQESAVRNLLGLSHVGLVKDS